MNIYFAGSIRGGRNDAALYHDIIVYLKNYGQVFTEHVGDPDLTARGDDGPDDQGIFRRDMAWLMQSHVVVAEVTQPSLGVGFELGMAVSLEMPVLALYRNSPEQVLSAMIGGCPDIRTAFYQTLSQASQAIDAFMESLGVERIGHE